MYVIDMYLDDEDSLFIKPDTDSQSHNENEILISKRLYFHISFIGFTDPFKLLRHCLGSCTDAMSDKNQEDIKVNHVT